MKKKPMNPSRPTNLFDQLLSSHDENDGMLFIELTIGSKMILSPMKEISSCIIIDRNYSIRKIMLTIFLGTIDYDDDIRSILVYIGLITVILFVVFLIYSCINKCMKMFNDEPITINKSTYIYLIIIKSFFMNYFQENNTNHTNRIFPQVDKQVLLPFHLHHI